MAAANLPFRVCVVLTKMARRAQVADAQRIRDVVKHIHSATILGFTPRQFQAVKELARKLGVPES